MSDVTFLSPRKDQAILTTHVEVLTRAGRETGVVNGNLLAASSPADMDVQVDAGRIKIAGAPMDVDAGAGTITAAHATLPRIDIIYRDTDGAVQVAAGTPAVIEDVKGLGEWRSYTSPVPAADIPDGAILGAVYVPAECAAITTAYIWMFAGGVGDIAAVVGDPGVDTRPASEKAVRDGLDTCAPAAQGVTNGDTHDHAGGDGAQISHANLSNIGTNAHSVIDLFIASKAASSGLASLDAGSRVVQNPKLHAADHASGGSDTVKLDDLAAPDDNTDLDASPTKHGLFPKFPNTRQALLGDKTWITRTFAVGFPFGDGSAVLLGQSCAWPIPIACKIVAAEIRSLDAAGAPLSGSITCALHKHARDAAIGDAVDSFALASATNMQETGLDIAVAAGDYLTVVISGITSCKQIVCSLTLEAT